MKSNKKKLLLGIIGIGVLFLMSCSLQSSGEKKAETAETASLAEPSSVSVVTDESATVSAVSPEPEPTPEPTILYICDLHGLYNDEVINIGKIEKGNKFRKYIYDPAYADYSFCFTLSLRTPSYKVSDVAAYTEQEAERLIQLGHNVWITGEDKTVIQGIATQKELQDSLVFSDGLAGMSAEDRERIKAQADFRKDIHMKKHAIGQTVFNLGNWLNNLTYARKAGNGVIDENAEIGGLVKIKVSEIFDNIDAAMKVLRHQIQTFDVSFGMKPENFSIADFLDEYLASHRQGKNLSGGFRGLHRDLQRQPQQV